VTPEADAAAYEPTLKAMMDSLKGPGGGAAAGAGTKG
jgi:hypothetical protein